MIIVDLLDILVVSLASFPLKFMEPRKPTKRQVKPRKSFPVGNTKGDNA